MKEMLRKVFVCPVDRQPLLQGEAWLVQATEGCPLQGESKLRLHPESPGEGGCSKAPGDRDARLQLNRYVLCTSTPKALC